MISNLRSSENAPAYKMAANEGVIKAIVTFYRDDSGASNNGFFLNALKILFRLSRVLLDL